MDGNPITLQLEVYLPFRGQRRWSGQEEVPAGTTAGGLPGLLGLTEPELTVLVNGRYAGPERVLEDGDQVVILRPAEGG